jgi:hypothetical protein
MKINKLNMKTILLFVAMTLFTSIGFGQIIAGWERVDSSKISPWLSIQKEDCQGVYHFGNSELESELILTIINDSCYAQIRSGSFTGAKHQFIWNFENLKNVRIQGYKFFSDKTNGEFAVLEKRKGLIIYKPWRSVAKNGEYEIGLYVCPLNKQFQGKYTYATWRLLTNDEMEKMTQTDLQIMRNEIYARYGYQFKKGSDMDLYFKKQPWYHGYYRDINNFLTGLEKQNIELIRVIEKSKNKS